METREAPPSGPSRRWSAWRWLRWLAVSTGIAVVVTAGVLELFFRLRGEEAITRRWTHPYVELGDFAGDRGEGGPQSPEAFGYRRRGLVYTYEPEAAVASMRERGLYRDPSLADVARAPDGRRTRIFVVGGSVALGDRASDEAHRWPRLLEERLRDTLGDRAITMVPAATRSFVSTQERIELELNVFPSKPDAIVVIDGFNDVSNFHFAARPGDPYNQGIAYARAETSWFAPLEALAAHSALVRHYFSKHVYAAVAEATHENGAPRRRAAYADGILRLYEDNLRHMIRRCHQEQVPCFFFFQPWRSLTEKRADPDRAGGDPLVETYEKMATAFVAARDAAPANAAIELSDITRIFDAKPSVFVDPCHPDDDGQAILADQIARVLVHRREWWLRTPTAR